MCFHGVGTPARDLEIGEARYWVRTTVFHAILDAVADDPRVRISFDDGNASDAVTALPALLERGLSATFFVLSGRLDEPGSLSREQVLELRDGGMGIGTHGRAHRPWRGLDPAAAAAELEGAREEIAELVGRPVDEAALPLGRYDRHLLTTLRRLGYRTVYTSDRRRARPGAWLQPRFSVRDHDTAARLTHEVLSTPGLPTRTRGELVGLVKRLR
ncbi:polysaccharide deacetylase family protein [Nocardioides sp. dk4132]|nr:polysaccharide deacetylase family protein [Nocardioides sp. dk4132]QGA09557.1 polysaccharide deacetylase family protein [Nocardioides sp. dk884]